MGYKIPKGRAQPFSLVPCAYMWGRKDRRERRARCAPRARTHAQFLTR